MSGAGAVTPALKKEESTRAPALPKLKPAGPAELIRAYQRDNEFIKRLKQDIDEMILEVFGKSLFVLS